MKALHFFLILFLGPVIVACTPAPTPTVPASVTAPVIPVTPQTWRTPTAAELKGCFAPGEYQAVDMVGPVDFKTVNTMRHLKVKTALRYFDWKGQESLKGKIPTPSEMALWKAAEIEMSLIFQHNNRPLSTFADTAGQDRYNRDPKEILAQAKEWGIPAGKTIWLGVDSDLYRETEKAAVRKYFEKVGGKIKAAGFVIGMYGNGVNCESLAKAGLIGSAGGKPLCWIAGSTGWSGYKETMASGRYVLKQKVNQTCGGKGMDFNKVTVQDFGQFKL